MADDKHYVPGDYYQIDDITGMKVRAGRTRKQWDGLITAPVSFSPRNPQDLVTGVKDDQSVPAPRPRQTNRFVFVATYVTSPALAGARSLTVNSSVGFTPGDSCQVMLDSGVQFPFTCATAIGGVITWTGAALPSTVGLIYGTSLDNTVVDLSTVPA